MATGHADVSHTGEIDLLALSIFFLGDCGELEPTLLVIENNADQPRLVGYRTNELER